MNWHSNIDSVSVQIGNKLDFGLLERQNDSLAARLAPEFRCLDGRRFFFDPRHWLATRLRCDGTNRQESSIRARHLHQIHLACNSVCRLGPHQPNARRSLVYGRSHCCSRQDGQTRQDETRRLHSLPQAQPSSGNHRSQNQQTQYF